jgi:hypothetical protein
MSAFRIGEKIELISKEIEKISLRIEQSCHQMIRISNEMGEKDFYRARNVESLVGSRIKKINLSMGLVTKWEMRNTNDFDRESFLIKKFISEISSSNSSLRSEMREREGKTDLNSLLSKYLINLEELMSLLELKQKKLKEIIDLRSQLGIKKVS